MAQVTDGYLLIAIGNYSRLPAVTCIIMPVCDYYCPVAQVTDGYWLIAIGNCSGLPCYLRIMPVRDNYCPVAQVTDGYLLIAIGNFGGLLCYLVTCIITLSSWLLEDGKAEMYTVGSPGNRSSLVT